MQFICLFVREIWERMEEEDVDVAKPELISKAKKLKVHLFPSTCWYFAIYYQRLSDPVFLESLYPDPHSDYGSESSCNN